MSFIPLVVSLMSLLCGFHVLGCDMNCENGTEVSPSRLVVKHGEPASAVCSLCQSCQSKQLFVEAPLGNSTGNETVRLWSVDRMTLWGTTILCVYYDLSFHLCCTALPVNVYKPPDSASISFTNHSGPMFEGHQYTLQCEVHNFAPAANLVVTFYRGRTSLGQLHLNNSHLIPVTEVFTHNFIATEEDDGVQFWCEGVLELGPEGPQHPPVVKSQNITATVHSLEVTRTPQTSTTSTKATNTKTTPNSSTGITLTHGFIMCGVLLLFSAVIYYLFKQRQKSVNNQMQP